MDAKTAKPSNRTDAPRGLLTASLFAVFLLASVAATQPLGGLSSRHLPANADGLWGAWILGQVCHGLASPSQLLRGPMFHPDPASLFYADPMIGIGLQSLPFCAAGFDHVALFNASYVLILAMSALGAWLLARELTGSAEAALVAASVFAFTSANYDSAARIQIVASQWTPFCLLFLIRFCRHGRLRDAVLTGSTFAMQALSCGYFEIFLAVLLVLALPFWIRLAGGLSAAWRRLPGALLAIAIAGVAVLPLNLAQRRHLDPILAERPQAQDVSLSFFIDVLPSNLLYGGVLGRSRVAYDAMYFPGLVAVALGLVFLFRFRKREVDRSDARAALHAIVAIGVLAFLFGFGARVNTSWGEFAGPLSIFGDAIPGLGQARVPSRFFMFTRLALAVVAAFAARDLLGSTRRSQWFRAAAIALAAYMEHYSAPLDTWVVPTEQEIPKAYAWLKESGPQAGALLEFPPALQRLRREEAAWLQLNAFHRVPMANGYSSFRPAWLEFVMEAALRWPDDRLLDILRRMDVRRIVLHPRPRGIEEVDRATAAFQEFAAAHPDRVRLVRSFRDERRWDGLWSRLGDEQIYEIISMTPPAAMPPLTAAIDRSGWTCRSTEPSCERALDGDVTTLLEGRELQNTGQFLKVWFRSPVTIDAVSASMGRLPEGFPREAVIRVLVGEEWRAVDAALDTDAFVRDLLGRSTNPMMVWRFTPVTAAGFEIRLRGGGHGFRALGLPEVNAHRATAPADAAPLR